MKFTTNPSSIPNLDIPFEKIGFLRSGIHYFEPGRRIEQFLVSVIGKFDELKQTQLEVTVTYKDSTNHTHEQIFHLDACGEQFTAPHIGQAWTRESGRSNIFICAVNAINLDVKLNGNRLAYHVQRELPTVLNVVLFPMKPNVKHHPIIHSVSVNTEPDVLATGFTVKSNGVRDTFLISDDGFATMSTSEIHEKIEFEGEYLFLRGNKFVMLNGKSLKVGKKMLAELDEPREHYMNMNG